MSTVTALSSNVRATTVTEQNLGSNRFTTSLSKIYPTFVKIVAFAVIAFALLGIAHFSTFLALALSIPSTAFFCSEAIQKLHVNRAKAQAFQLMKEAIGGQEVYDSLPIIGNINSFLIPINPEDMSAPIMKGTYSERSPCICIKLIQTESRNQEVVTFFQEDPERGKWLVTGSSSRNIRALFFGAEQYFQVVTENHRNILNQIVVRRNHPTHQLAEDLNGVD